MIDAPRELVFRAWKEPGHIGKWFGPVGFRITTEKMEFKPGGQWLFVMHGPDGTDFINKITYRNIAEPERLEYDQAGEDDWVKFRVVVTFEDKGGKTLITLNSIFDTAEMRRNVVENFGAIEGGHQCLARLSDHVAAMEGAFTLTRTFDAPRELVFRLWTEAEHLGKWFGPKGATTRPASLELKPGGMFHYYMKAPNGVEMWAKWIFREVVRPERIVFVQSFSDKDAGMGRNPFMPLWPLETLSTVDFAEQDGRTTVALTAVPINATAEERAAFEAAKGGMTIGWTSTLDQLAAYLPAAKEVHIERFFNAPPEAVFKAWTNAESLRKWYAPDGCATPFVEVDVRVGGMFRYCIATPTGYHCWCGGKYLEVVPNRRLVSTLYRTDEAGNMVEPAAVGMDPEWPREMVLSISFEPRDGGTLVTLRQTVSEVVAKRTGAHPSWLQMFDRLASELATM